MDPAVLHMPKLLLWLAIALQTISWFIYVNNVGPWNAIIVLLTKV